MLRVELNNKVTKGQIGSFLNSTTHTRHDMTCHDRSLRLRLNSTRSYTPILSLTSYSTVTPFRCSYLADISAKRHACTHACSMYGWRDVWMSGGADAQPCCCLSISQRALLSPLHARMHAYSACVVRALRHVFVSRPQASLIKPQGSGGVTRTLNLPEFSSLLFAFASNTNNTHRDLAPCLPASQPVRPPGAAPVPIISPARAVPRHR
jgi:hypothetical protein